MHGAFILHLWHSALSHDRVHSLLSGNQYYVVVVVVVVLHTFHFMFSTLHPQVASYSSLDGNTGRLQQLLVTHGQIIAV